MYLSFNEYTSYGGTLNETTFNTLEKRSEVYIDRYTFKRVQSMQTVPDAVKLCVFELIKYIQLYDKVVSNMNAVISSGGTSGLVASFDTDGYKESYATGSGNSGTYLKDMSGGIDSVISKLIHDYLDMEFDDKGTRLTYRGVYDETLY